MNESDSERITTLLENQGLKPAKNIEQASLIVFNTCGVRQTAEDRVYGQVHNVRKYELKDKKIKDKKIIILTGCLAHRQDVQRKLKDKVDLFLPINNLFKIENWNIKNLKSKDSIQKNKINKKNCYLSISPKYTNKHSAFIPIMTGCDNFCSYCVVPYARGREWSRPPEDIFKEVKNLAKDGCQEITLLGQNVNSYFFKIENSKIDWKLEIGNWKLRHRLKKTIGFPVLLDILASSIPNISWRFLTSHPKDFSDDLIKVIAENKNISREIHLPVQSGSNKILKLMNRPYTKEKYLNLIAKIKKQIPEASFSTDVIIGFPGETEKDFQETIKVFKKVGFFEAYINKYSPRPETIAFKLGNPITWDEKKRREKVLRKLIKQF